jgi:hypothetical protein
LDFGCPSGLISPGGPYFIKYNFGIDFNYSGRVTPSHWQQLERGMMFHKTFKEGILKNSTSFCDIKLYPFFISISEHIYTFLLILNKSKS